MGHSYRAYRLHHPRGAPASAGSTSAASRAAGRSVVIRVSAVYLLAGLGFGTGFGHERVPSALIETAAFVPHLSGMKNLELWWTAGGARFADANLDEALAIADLGTAINRKVKTY